MTVTQNPTTAISLNVTPDLSVNIFPNPQHEFVMSGKEVALGYGSSESVIRNVLFRYPNEFRNSLHYLKGSDFRDQDVQGVKYFNSPKGAQPHQTFWTKRGIVRLGFFIKSERANLFRDWAEQVIIDELNSRMRLANVKSLSQKKYKHNRLTSDRIINILSEVAKVEDKALRMSIIDLLTNKE